MAHRRLAAVGRPPRAGRHRADGGLLPPPPRPSRRRGPAGHDRGEDPARGARPRADRRRRLPQRGGVLRRAGADGRCGPGCHYHAFYEGAGLHPPARGPRPPGRATRSAVAGAAGDASSTSPGSTGAGATRRWRSCLPRPRTRDDAACWPGAGLGDRHVLRPLRDRSPPTTRPAGGRPGRDRRLVPADPSGSARSTATTASTTCCSRRRAGGRRRLQTVSLADVAYFLGRASTDDRRPEDDLVAAYHRPRRPGWPATPSTVPRRLPLLLLQGRSSRMGAFSNRTEGDDMFMAMTARSAMRTTDARTCLTVLWSPRAPARRGHTRTERQADGQGHRRHHDVGRRLRRRPDDGPGCGLGEGGERLHYWVFGGPWTYDAGAGGRADRRGQAVARLGHGRPGRRRRRPQHVRVRPTIGAGRTRGTYRCSSSPTGPRRSRPSGGFTFVDGVEEAVARAMEAAGDKDVNVMGGADVIRQALAPGWSRS